MTSRLREVGLWVVILAFSLVVTAVGAAAAGWLARQSCCAPTQELARERLGIPAPPRPASRRAGTDPGERGR